MKRSLNTIKWEINRFKNIENYQQYDALNDYLKKRKKCIKKPPKLSKKKLEWLNIRFNKYHNSPWDIIKRYEKKLRLNFQFV